MWGDELNYWAVMVKGMLHYGRFSDFRMFGLMIDPNYPPLWPLMTVAGLAVSGKMNEAAGRIMTLLIVFGGSLFAYKELREKWNYSIINSLAWTSIMFVLIVLPAFPYSASWYSDISFSIFLMASTYSFVMGLISEHGFPMKRLIHFSLFQAIIIGMRPDGYIFIPLYICIGIYAILIRAKNTKQHQYLLLVSSIIVPFIFIFSIWKWYMWKANIGTTHYFSDPAARGMVFMSREWVSWATVKLLDGKLTIKKFWWVLAPQIFCLLACMGFYSLIWRRFRLPGRLLIVSAVLFPIYKLIEVLIYNFFITPEVKFYFIRYLLQTAPLVYFVLGVVLLEYLKTKLSFSGTLVRGLMMCILASAVIICFFTGAVYARLPSILMITWMACLLRLK